jgi:hypothetical protein
MMASYQPTIAVMVDDRVPFHTIGPVIGTQPDPKALGACGFMSHPVRTGRAL